MQPNISPAGSAFSRTLRAFQTGGSTRDNLLAQVNHQLAEGASAGELLDILRRREKVEPLPSDVRQAIMALLVPPEPEARPRLSASGGLAPPEAPTIILDETGGAGERTAAAAADEPAWAEGDVLGGRYQLVQLIGEGGMSRVYTAIDALRTAEGTRAPYIAVKLFTRPFNEQPETFAAFQQEVTKLRRLSHPNIVRTFDCERDGAALFLTMEYLGGDSLYVRLHAGGDTAPGPSLAHEAARSLISAVADALAYAHENQVVHGDLKPGNVIITEAGEVKVIDFGIATWAARPRTALERREAAQTHGAAALTPRYASPQLMARQKPEAADDVYALACLAYELLTGSHPFDDDNGVHVLRFPPPLRAGLTATQYDAVMKGLQFERRNRTPTVRQFIEEFTAQPRRSKAGALPVIAGIVVILAFGAWFYTRPSKIEPARLPASDSSPAAPVQAPPAAPKPGSVIRDCPTCPQLTVLPIGRFEEGSADDETGALPFEKPRHPVAIGYSLAVSTSDVTVGDFREFAAATRREMQGCDIYDGEWRHRPKASWTDPGFTQDDTHPVTCVSWNDASAYVDWLSMKSGHRYRLPSASEWEYAARAGGELERPWDTGGGACNYANVADQSAARRYPGWEAFPCDDGYVDTAPVGSFKTNAFGLNDMLGNVFQWTQDCWHDDYGGAPADGAARVDGNCAEHELRGGSWFSSPPYVRAAYRNRFAANYRTSSVGFRVVREVGQ